MKVGIVGSRDFRTGRHFIGRLVHRLTEDDYVVTGGADGADSWAEYYAKKYGKSRIIHMAKWRTQWRAAGPIRNALIVNDADQLFAFYTDKAQSKGTADCVAQARKKGIPVMEYDAATEDYPSWLDDFEDFHA